MTKRLEQAIQAVRNLPPARQDDIAESLVMAASNKDMEYTADQINAMREGLDQANARNFVSQQTVNSLFAKYRGI